jgi:hypothetical protein
MKTSTEVDQISAAVVAFQGTVGAVKKDAENPHFKSKFASLKAIVDDTRATLVAQGLGVTQWPCSDDHGPTLVTRVLHTSGQWMESEMPLFLPKEDPQGQGSALTYARRYAYSAALGIVTEEDDDAQSATEHVRSGGTARRERGEARAPRRPPAAPVDPQTCQTCGERQTTKFGPDGAPECPSCAAKRAQAEE